MEPLEKEKGAAGQGALSQIPPESYRTKSPAELLGAGKTRADLNFPDVKNDYELDNALIGQTVTSNGCVVKAPWVRKDFNTPGYWSEGYIKPCAAYLSYIKKDTVPSGTSIEYSLTKKKGFSRQFTASTEVKVGVSAGIFGCETSLEVTTGFSYSETINEETTETWKKTLTGPQDYWTFQPVLLYAWKVNANALSYMSPKPSLYYTSGKTTYIFSPVFRNSPSTIDKDIGYLSLQTVIEYMCNEAWSRW
ncbi:hypothetical protein [Myxococcus fulvus]|nr:hypothetical protein [Myxococcus fulvus]